MSYFYKLEGRTPVPVDTLPLDHPHVQVADTTFGDVRVSTIFMTINHAFNGGPPLVFETLVFGGEHDGHGARASTWDEALLDHAKAVELCGLGVRNLVLSRYDRMEGISMEIGPRVEAPWSQDQVNSLNEYQDAGCFHPFTHESKNLIATTDGWVVAIGEPVIQTWAHQFMTDWAWKATTTYEMFGKPKP